MKNNHLMEWERDWIRGTEYRVWLPNMIIIKRPVHPAVVMYGCESWTIKKAECRRIDAFELWCWGRLWVPWTARRSNQSILKEISPGCLLDWCWSWNSNTLVTWCEELSHLKRSWFWERLRAGGEGDDRGWDGWMASLTQWTWVWVNSRSWWWTGRPGTLWFMGPHSRPWLSNWTELNWHPAAYFSTVSLSCANAGTDLVKSQLEAILVSSRDAGKWVGSAAGKLRMYAKKWSSSNLIFS